MLRQSILRQARTPLTYRAFSTQQPLFKTPLEAGKDALKTVDRAVSDVAIKGLDAGETATNKIKETVGAVAGQAEEASNMSKGEMKGKAQELAGEAKGKASELSGKTSGKASELGGKAQAKAGELEGKAKANM